jgi:hypothetical protein
MKNTIFKHMAWVIVSFLMAGVSLAAGRSEEPPAGMLDAYKLAQQTMEALNAGDNAKAAELIKEGRKISLDSYKERSTMPMQIASTGFKDARSSLEANDGTKAKADIQHVIEKLTSEIDYYKQHGKIQ